MPDKNSILLIEDDTAISRGLCDAFEEELYDVTVCKDGAEGLSLAMSRQFSCIILDLMLPSMNGREVCKKLRAAGNLTPILMLTSKSAESDMILGLELGADDYMSKPFSVRELMARVRALLRRVLLQTPSHKSETDELQLGAITIDFIRKEVVSNGGKIPLLQREAEILQYFRMNAGKEISREMLLDAVWGYEHFPTTRSVDNYILGLRKKIEENPSSPKYLLTVHTIGYKFSLDE